MKMKKVGILFACLLAACTALPGCSANDVYEIGNDVKPGKTISSHSKWINSDIVGAIDESVKVSEKDDFHTAINYEWILNTEIPEAKSDDDKKSVSTFDDAKNNISNQTETLIRKDDTQVDSSIMSQNTYNHLQDLTSGLANLWSDWDSRNALGAEPVRQYIEDIENINSLDEMSAYLSDVQGSDFAFTNLFSISVMAPHNSREQYSVWIMPVSSWLMGDSENYSKTSKNTYIYQECNEKEMTCVLGKLGYSQRQIDKILSQAYQFESKIAAFSANSSEADGSEEYYKNYVNEKYSLEDLTKFAGNLPLEEMLSSVQLADSKKFTLVEKDYLKGVASAYTEKNLDLLKSFLITKMVNSNISYLDRDSYEVCQEVATELGTNEIDTDLTGEELKQEETLKTVESELEEVMDQLYVARYVKSEDKENLSNMIDEVVSYYRTMLQSEDWFSEETKEKAIEKLDNLTLHVLYPDQMEDYSDLNIDSNGTLMDAINSINQSDFSHYARKVNQKLDKTNDWSLMRSIGLTWRDVNAAYILQDNSINILPGVLGDKALYDAEDTMEHNYGAIGMIVGHEISHAFDTSGAEYDKDGYYKNWWTDKDLETFNSRARKLVKYYDSLEAGAVLGDYGEKIKDEAIADMGSMQCMLVIAKSKENFNYETFFKSFAQVWRTKETYGYAKMIEEKDTHPFAFLRTNVTVQQFDEFYKTFNIEKGDGMYLAPNKRISVW